MFQGRVSLNSVLLLLLVHFVSELEFTYISLIVNIRSILHKSIQFMLEFLKGPVLVLHFSCCILMTLMMLTVILLSMLMRLLSILSVIRHLICGNNLNWLLNLNLTYETPDWGKTWLVGFNNGKTQLVLFDWSNNNGSIDLKMDGSVIEEK